MYVIKKKKKKIPHGGTAAGRKEGRKEKKEGRRLSLDPPPPAAARIRSTQNRTSSQRTPPPPRHAAPASGRVKWGSARPAAVPTLHRIASHRTCAPAPNTAHRSSHRSRRDPAACDPVGSSIVLAPPPLHMIARRREMCLANLSENWQAGKTLPSNYISIYVCMYIPAFCCRVAISSRYLLLIYSRRRSRTDRFSEDMHHTYTQPAAQ